MLDNKKRLQEMEVSDLLDEIDIAIWVEFLKDVGNMFHMNCGCILGMEELGRRLEGFCGGDTEYTLDDVVEALESTYRDKA